MVVLAFSEEVNEVLAKTLLVLSSYGFEVEICIGKKKLSSRHVLMISTEEEKEEGLLVKEKTIYFSKKDVIDNQWWEDLYRALLQVLNEEFLLADRLKMLHPMDKLLNH